MEWQQLVIDLFERTCQELERVLDGLSVDDLNQRPHSDCNCIGWLAWHLTRSQDRNMAEVLREKQLWVKDSWHIKFGRTQDPAETGFGHSSEDAAAFRSPRSETLLGYHHAVLERSKRFINNRLSETELKRRSKSSTLGTVSPVRARLLGVISENLQHVGQAAYVRGLLQGKGWLGR